MPLQHRQNLPQHAHLAAHAPLGQRDDREVLLAGDAGDEPVGIRIPIEPLPDHGARILGGIGIADVQRDVLLPDREDGSLVEDLSAAVAQLPQFVVGDLRDGLGIVHDPGVCHQDAGHVGPVLVDIGIQSRRRQCAGDIAAPPGEGLDLPVRELAVEAGDHHAGAAHQDPQGLIAALLVHGAVEAEMDPVRRVDELETQEVRHEPGGEILAPGGQLILGDGFLVQLGLQGRKLRLQVDGKAQVTDDLPVPGGDHLEDAGAVHTVLGVGEAQIQQVRDLVVLLVPLAGSGDDDHPPLRIRQQYIPDLSVLARVRHGGAAEFDYFHMISFFLRQKPR